MINVLSIVGTRPEAIKMAPVIKAFEAHSNCIQSVVCSTGQHRQMLDQVFQLFNIHADRDLNVMQPNQSLAGLTAKLFEALDGVIKEEQPNWIIAQGDTTTVMVASMLAFYHHIPFAHVEAGLRTGNLEHPFPEELNRVIADRVSSLMFAPTAASRDTLLREGVPAERVLVTGNTVIDALQYVAKLPFAWEASSLAALPRDRTLVLVTAHRRESFGAPFREICLALRQLADRFTDVYFVYPVHLNPNVRGPVNEILGGLANFCLLEPLDYLTLVQLMKRAKLILTDSGGIQEEAPGLRVPALVMRETTERPEGVTAGVVKLVGTSRERIVSATAELLTNESAWQTMRTGENPYGDGHAAERIVAALLERS